MFGDDTAILAVANIIQVEVDYILENALDRLADAELENLTK